MADPVALERTFRGSIWNPQAPEQGLDVWRAFLAAGMEDIVQEVSSRTPRDEGDLINSIQESPSIRTWGDSAGMHLEGRVGTPLLYGKVMESGRGPNKRGPPYQVIIDWVPRARAAGKISYEDKDEWIVTWRIWLKIHTKGTKGRFMFRDGLAAAEPKLRSRMADAQAAWMRIWGSG